MRMKKLGHDVKRENILVKVKEHVSCTCMSLIVSSTPRTHRLTHEHHVVMIMVLYLKRASTINV
jgi:hypothetical protein